METARETHPAMILYTLQGQEYRWHGAPFANLADKATRPQESAEKLGIFP